MKAFSLIRTGLFLSVWAITFHFTLLKAQTESSGCGHSFFSHPLTDQATWWQVQAARCDDNTAHTAADLSKWAPISATLQMEDFQLDIPKDAQIKGIEVVVIRRSQGEGSLQDHEIHLIRNGRRVGANIASAGTWDQEWTAAFYGGPEELMGATWSPVLLNSPHFGINLSVRQTEGNPQAQIDEVNITVHYSLPDHTYPTSAFKKSVCIPGPY